MSDDVHINIPSDAAGGDGVTINIDGDVTIDIHPPQADPSTQPTE